MYSESEVIQWFFGRMLQGSFKGERTESMRVFLSYQKYFTEAVGIKQSSDCSAHPEVF